MARPFAVSFTYAEFLVSAVVFVPVLGAVRLRSRGDPTHRSAGHWLRNFGKVTSALTPLWHFSIEGEPPSDIGSRPYVVISNHESNADPFLLSWLPWDMRWVSKQELFELPLLGALMWLGGDIALRRGDADSVHHMLEECHATLQQGLSVMIFPEGTRSRDGRLGPFKNGAFRLAIEARVPILPVAIAGTASCLPTGKTVLGEAHAVARVLTPINTSDLTLDAVDTLREQARTRIALASIELRAQLGH